MKIILFFILTYSTIFGKFADNYSIYFKTSYNYDSNLPQTFIPYSYSYFVPSINTTINFKHFDIFANIAYTNYVDKRSAYLNDPSNLFGIRTKFSKNRFSISPYLKQQRYLYSNFQLSKISTRVGEKSEYKLLKKIKILNQINLELNNYADNIYDAKNLNTTTTLKYRFTSYKKDLFAIKSISIAHSFENNFADSINSKYYANFFDTELKFKLYKTINSFIFHTGQKTYKYKDLVNFIYQQRINRYYYLYLNSKVSLTNKISLRSQYSYKIKKSTTPWYTFNRTTFNIELIYQFL